MPINKARYMKVIYLNDWLLGSWQVQKIHAQEFINAFKKQKGLEVFAYPRNEIINFKSEAVNGKKIIIGLCKTIFNKFAPELIKYQIGKLVKNRKLINIVKEIEYINPDVILIRHNLSYFPILEELFKLEVPIVLEVNGLVQNHADLVYSKNLDKIMETERKIFNQVHALCCVSQKLGESIKLMGTDPKKIFVVPNGSDPLKFFPHRKSNKLCKKYDLEGKVVIGYVGGFVNGKPEGRDVIGMLRAFQIAEKREKNPIKLLMVGRMDENYLNKTIKELKIDDLVTFTGFIEHERLPETMNLIDIAVAPYFENRLKDASPMKLFEYMAMAKPVIIPGVGQVPEIIKDMESGVLVEAENILSLADALSNLIEDGNLRQSIGSNARKVIKEKYTWEHNAERVAKVCRSVMRNKLHLG